MQLDDDDPLGDTLGNTDVETVRGFKPSETMRPCTRFDAYEYAIRHRWGAEIFVLLLLGLPFGLPIIVGVMMAVFSFAFLYYVLCTPGLAHAAGMGAAGRRGARPQSALQTLPSHC